MDLEAFLKWEKESLREDRERLNQILQCEKKTKEINEQLCPAQILLEQNPNIRVNCNRNKIENNDNFNLNSETKPIRGKSGDSSSRESTTSTQASSMPTKVTTKTTSDEQTSLNTYAGTFGQEGNPEENPNKTFSFYTHCEPEYETENASILTLGENANSLTKCAKEVANQQTALHSATPPASEEIAANNADADLHKFKKRGKDDDMEQWVTDTFYSYFPGFNDELQKRQRHLRERQQENQQNFLKHQLTHPPLPRNARHKNRRHFDDDEPEQVVSTARSSSTSATSTITNTNPTMSHPTNKTDLEIIVNNPGYVPPKHLNSRPNTTRHRLLQDLRHTELSNIVSGDGVTERNRHTAELETERKKDYQRELMQQIEEKRRSIELLREKERRQDEVLTRRLQEQLKTIQLEEQLEKEKMRADKLRFDSEQNRLMREHLLAKLELDTKLLYESSRENVKSKVNIQDLSSQKVEKVPGTATTADVAAITTDADNKKVYKYFSNSARHEYRRGKPLPEELELDLDIPVRDADELECFHLSEKVCPMCDGPLKHYESCCLRCQKKLSLRLKTKRNSGVAKANKDDNKESEKTESLNESRGSDDNSVEGADGVGHDVVSYSMVCEKCERLYALCPSCLAQSEVCRACHRKRNVCMSCRRTLCTRCLDEIASGRDVERFHINEADNKQNLTSSNRLDQGSERSFQVLEVNYPDANANEEPNTLPSNQSYVHINRDALNANPRRNPPYSMSIERNSIFHPDNQTSFEPSNDQFSLEHMRKETDKRLSRFLRNYGDLAINPRTRSRSESGQDRSTQTTPNTAARRDVVMNEEHNLSMPLLREMPKMTRNESNHLMLRKPKHSKNSRRIEELKQRWEVPAVQKFTISSTSPKVLTQVGAIRKQMQAEHFFGNEMRN